MTQEPPKPTPPDNQKPNPLLTQLRSLWQQLQPSLVRQTIVVLQATIRGLQRAETKLTDIAADLPAPASSENEFWARIRPMLARLWQLWRGLLQRLRSLLPPAWQQKLANFSDPVLSGAIAAVLLLFLWTTSALTSHPTPAPVIATRPAAKPLPTPITTTPPTLAPAPKPGAPTPVPLVIKPKPFELEEPADQVTTGPAISQTPAPTPLPPLAETPTDVPSPKPSPELTPPPPVIQLSPEQALIADVRSQVSDITDRYGTALSQNIQPNFVRSRLQLQLTNEWYKLKPEEQSSLAQALWQQSQELDFSRLEILDLQNHLLARNPVVGDQVIILRRKLV